uniref:RING-type E3 ubiquitin transferase n=1 Tax=Plectus sambesii TaxID=2011161 RepID=A0A914WK26_9BILA
MRGHSFYCQCDRSTSVSDICRVCRSEGTPDRPLYYPCLCTGSIKYVHQECLLQWLKYSKKEICELCTHKYSFQPIYLPDMPKRLPVADVVLGMGRNVVRLVRAWFLYTIVVIAWLGIVPLTACRIYRAIFSGSVTSLLLLPLELLSIATIYLVTGHARVHELYTVASGLYVSWLALKLFIMIGEWLPRGWRVVVSGFHQWFITCAKVLAAALAVVGLVPFLLGTCFQLIVIAPMRVSRLQSPLFFPWQDWAMGVLHCKIACAAIMMGPDWWMKTVFERLYQDGLRNLNLKYLYMELVFPIVVSFGLVITVPYALSNGVVGILGGSMEERLLFLRHSYPALLLFFSCLAFVIWQCEKIRGLAQRIRNDKYLVGTQLVNYERREASDANLDNQERPRSSTA